MENYKLKELLTKKNIIIAISVVMLVLLCFFITTILRNILCNSKSAKEWVKIAEENTEPVFKVSKILLYSSADAVDTSEGNLLKSLDISAYTDIAVYIDNLSLISELTPENTIKELYIDNIIIEMVSDERRKDS